MIGVNVRDGPLRATVSKKWVKSDDLTLSCEKKIWPNSLRALILHWIWVDPGSRRQGIARRFIESLTREPGYDIVVAEGVADRELFLALGRWGWECNPRVSDFYLRKAAMPLLTFSRQRDGVLETFVCRCECGGNVFGTRDMGRMWTGCDECSPVQRVNINALRPDRNPNHWSRK